MDHDTLENLKKNHTTLKLLNAAHMPLIVSFLFKVFISPNRRSMAQSDLIPLLEDHLFQLRELCAGNPYPRSARDYLEEWAAGETAFLRKYYTDTSDEPVMDLTPASEKAMEWLADLKEQSFVGTESRLLTVLQLLRDIAYKTEKDPQERIRILENKKNALDREIREIKSRGVLPHDPTQIKERFFQVEETAKKLLSDFRQVEHNFRKLDLETRARIAKSDKSKGELLDEIFHDQDVIRDSDQGKSFKAFWEFLMSEISREEMTLLLEKIKNLKEIQALDPDPFIFDIQYLLLDAGEKVYKTGNLLVEQLRKYLDDQAYLENRRIMTLVKAIEKKAVDIRENPPPGKTFAHICGIKPDFDFTMGRTLFSPPKNPVITTKEIRQGEADIETHALFNQTYIDTKTLKLNIRKALETVSQISLLELTRTIPIEKGVAEAVAYLNLASRDKKALVNEKKRETIFLKTEQGQEKTINMPQIIFTR